MSSVTRFLKQIPTDTPYFLLNSTATTVALSVWQPDANASINSYASGYAAGQFSASTATLSAGATLWRDMGKTVVSAGRTFRRIQMLIVDGNGAEFSAGFAPTNEGVVGAAVTGSAADAGFNVFWFETGARGLGLYNNFIRYG
jgi:hypothetical protein